MMAARTCSSTSRRNQKIGYELQSGRDGKQSAGDLRLL